MLVAVRNPAAVSLTTGLWGIWMPVFLHSYSAVPILFVGLPWCQHLSARKSHLTWPPCSVNAYGVQWWPDRPERVRYGGDPRPNGFMSISFTVCRPSATTVFFKEDDVPVALRLRRLTVVYV